MNKNREKQFDQWNEIKKQINSKGKTLYCHERQVWWCAIGVNVGFEQDGSGNEFRRPVVILKKLSLETCAVVPLTASKKEHPLRPIVGKVGNIEARAIITQFRVIDTKRLVSKIGYLEKNEFKKIKKSVKDLI